MEFEVKIVSWLLYSLVRDGVISEAVSRRAANDFLRLREEKELSLMPTEQTFLHQVA